MQTGNRYIFFAHYIGTVMVNFVGPMIVALLQEIVERIAGFLVLDNLGTDEIIINQTIR